MIQAIYTQKFRYALVIVTAVVLINGVNPLFAMGVSANCQSQKKCNGADMRNKNEELVLKQEAIVGLLEVSPGIIPANRMQKIKRKSQAARTRFDRTTDDDFQQSSKKRKNPPSGGNVTSSATDPSLDEFDDDLGGEMVDNIDDVIAALDELEAAINSANSAPVSAQDFSAFSSLDTVSAAASAAPPVEPADAGFFLVMTVANIATTAAKIADAIAENPCRQVVAGFSGSAGCTSFDVTLGVLEMISTEINLVYTTLDAQQQSTIQRRTGENWTNIRTVLTQTQTAAGSKSLAELAQDISNAVVPPPPAPGQPPSASLVDLIQENQARLEELAAQQDRLEAQQQVIIDLLQTPQGLRAGFNK